MSEGELRRPPLLWEQRLQALIPNVGVQGVADSEVIGDSPPGPGAGDEDPVDPPVIDDDPATPRLPSAPIVAGVTLGLVITWDGKDFTGVLMPAGSYVDVHVSTVSGFTPAAGNLVGRITGAGSFTYTAGTAGTTYYVKFVAFGPNGVSIGESAQASASPGLVQGPEINGDAVITQIVSATTPATTFALGSIWLNTANGTYNVLENVGGTPTWVLRPWKEDAINANAITANQIASQAILTKFLTGEIIRTGPADAARVQLSAANGLQVFRNGTDTTFWAKPTGEVIFGTASVSSGGTTVINGDSITSGTITGVTVQSASSGKRVALTNGAVLRFLGSGGQIRGDMEPDDTYGLTFRSVNGFVFGPTTNWSLNTPLVQILPDGTVQTERVISSNVIPSGATGVCYFGQRLGTVSLPLAASEALMRLRSNTTTEEDKFQVRANGDVLSRTNSYGGFSDERLKENIRDARGYLEDLRQVQVRKYNFIGSAEDNLGVIGQELQQVFPSMIGEDTDGMLHVKTSVFTPMLITAVQELADKVEALESQVSTQQAQIDALTARLDSLQ